MKLTFPLVALTLLITACNGEHAKLEMNKRAVIGFYHKAFNEHLPKEAIDKYVGNEYIQHNPHAGDGKEPFISYFTELFKTNQSSFIEIKRIIAEKDLVMVHIHSRKNKKDRGRAVMDIFRLEKGKIVEHWDVGQKIPEKLAHNNTMF